MASKSETGIEKNISHFDTLILTCQGFGAEYNPTNKEIEVATLSTQASEIKAEQKSFLTKKAANSEAKNKRKVGFAPVKKLSTRIVNALKSTKASKETVEDAKAFKRKIDGERAESKKKPANPSEPDNAHSVSQQSYTNIVAHLKGLSGIIEAEPTYIPNENDLKVATVTALISNLESLNDKENATYVAMNTGKIARDKKLFNDQTGLLATVTKVKDYVSSVYGATSPELKLLTKLKFVDNSN